MLSAGNLSESDASILQTFGPGQGIVSGQAVRFPLLVKVKFDGDLVSEAIGDEDFIAEAGAWIPDPSRAANAATVRRHVPSAPAARTGDGEKPTGRGEAGKQSGKPAPKQRKKPKGRRGRIQPEGFACRVFFDDENFNGNAMDAARSVPDPCRTSGLPLSPYGRNAA